jgi:hypothetical protein
VTRTIDFDVEELQVGDLLLDAELEIEVDIDGSWQVNRVIAPKATNDDGDEVAAVFHPEIIETILRASSSNHVFWIEDKINEVADPCDEDWLRNRWWKRVS